MAGVPVKAGAVPGEEEALELVTRAGSQRDRVVVVLGGLGNMEIVSLDLVEPPKRPKREEGGGGRGSRVGLIAKVEGRRTCRDSARPKSFEPRSTLSPQTALWPPPIVLSRGAVGEGPSDSGGGKLSLPPLLFPLLLPSLP